ncbi:hypothetical protein [Botryobacter ruber]|uniref:hypothetical protein n=1 Tax=Botryobacter ruber TaxID=2171629 RepID=UPI000E0B62E1|nr:hypothetical protein [Botryobacter ruber]
MQQQLQDIFANVMGLSLTNTTRNELVQYFHFGSTHYTTPQGLVLDVGEFTLALNCPWQLYLPDGSILKHDEVFQRKREAGLPAPGAPFDWKVPGANLRDQRLKELVNKNEAMAPTRIEAGEHYSFSLFFSNGLHLTVTPDTSKPEDVYWQLFSNTNQNISLRAGKSGLTTE